MLRTNEIKSIMRKLRDDQESSVKNESLVTEAEETGTENDTSEADLLLARLEDIISRFEKALSIVDAEEEPAEDQTEDKEDQTEEEPAEEEPAEDQAEEEPAEEAEESYQHSLEDRLAALERRFTESRRRKACRKFIR